MADEGQGSVALSTWAVFKVTPVVSGGSSKRSGGPATNFGARSEVATRDDTGDQRSGFPKSSC